MRTSLATTRLGSTSARYIDIGRTVSINYSRFRQVQLRTSLLGMDMEKSLPPGSRGDVLLSLLFVSSTQALSPEFRMAHVAAAGV